MSNRSIAFFLTVVSSLLGGTFAQAAEQYAVTYERNVPVKMRDGVILRADIYRPTADGKFPVLLQRTPYNKDDGLDFGLKAAQHGFVVIFEDVRGRYASEGEWYTFKNEPNDGYDTVEWAAALPYSNGKVGMFGGSYVGATQMLAAIAHPPHLAGICPIVTASNYHSNWVYQGGAFEQWFDQSWTSGLAQNTFDREVADNTNALQGIPTSLATIRCSISMSLRIRRFDQPLAPYYLDWLAHPNYDKYWKASPSKNITPTSMFPRCTSPLGTTFFKAASLRNYKASRRSGGNDAARAASSCWSSSAATPATAPKSEMSISAPLRKSTKTKSLCSGTNISSRARTTNSLPASGRKFL